MFSVFSSDTQFVTEKDIEHAHYDSEDCNALIYCKSIQVFNDSNVFLNSFVFHDLCQCRVSAQQGFEQTMMAMGKHFHSAMVVGVSTKTMLHKVLIACPNLRKLFLDFYPGGETTSQLWEALGKSVEDLRIDFSWVEHESTTIPNELANIEKYCIKLKKLSLVGPNTYLEALAKCISSFPQLEYSDLKMDFTLEQIRRIASRCSRMHVGLYLDGNDTQVLDCFGNRVERLGMYNWKFESSTSLQRTLSKCSSIKRFHTCNADLVKALCSAPKLELHDFVLRHGTDSLVTAETMSLLARNTGALKTIYAECKPSISAAVWNDFFRANQNLTNISIIFQTSDKDELDADGFEYLSAFLSTLIPLHELQYVSIRGAVDIVRNNQDVTLASKTQQEVMVEFKVCLRNATVRLRHRKIRMMIDDNLILPFNVDDGALVSHG